MIDISKEYWEKRWEAGETGWDIGYASPPITNYIDSLENKDLQILIPGCGNAYEGAYLHENGFQNTYLLDISESALKSVSERFPKIPKGNLLQKDFFEHEGSYDLIFEQTFFCALYPSFRPDYARKMQELLKPGGKLVGLLFNAPLFEEHPPFGGSKEEYLNYFESLFDILNFDTAPDSIKPRAGRELFIELLKTT